MKKLAFGALMMIGLLAACGGDDGKKVTIVDGSTIDAVGVCNPLTQAGCMAGEKCTWLLDATTPSYVGHVGCAPDGAANTGDSCMFGAPGASGYDGCKKGSVCGNYRGGTGVCKAICDQQGGQPMCDATHVCVTYSGLFSTGDTTPAAGGVCDLACDPFADNDFDGSGSQFAKTGATCAGGAAVGCYGYPSYGTPPVTGWSCTNDINSMEPGVGLRHRVQCTEANNCADAGPTIYVNSCNQGYLPLLRESTTVSTAICVAMCKPLDCWDGANAHCGTGNASRLGSANGRCNATDRAGTFDTAANGEHCQFLWYREVDDMGNFLQSMTSDSMGFCFAHNQYQYDSNNDNTPDTDLPSCASLTQEGFGSGSDPGVPLAYWGAADLGCVSTTHVQLANGKKLPDSVVRKRASIDLPRALYRRTMSTRP